MKCKIRRRMYTIREVRSLGGKGGECDSPDTPGKEIRIVRSLRGERRLAVILHEALHAGLWDTDEDAVNELADDAARLLTRMGYRRVE